MKVFVNTISPKYVIDVCAYISDDVFGGVEIYHPINMRKRNRLSDNELDIWTSIIESVMSELTSRNFKIVQHGQSKKSYSYYFNFYPVSNDGVTLELVQIRFRISNHQPSSAEQFVSTTKQIFRNFTINDIVCPANVLDLMNKIGRICDGLKVGDYSVITQV